MADGQDHSDRDQFRSTFLFIDHWLGRRSTTFAFIFFTSYATVFGGLLSSLLFWAIYGPPPFPLVLTNTFVSAIVSAPVVYYSQLMIRKLARTKRDLAALTERLSTAYEAAEAANRAKSAFLANMSHELRTPLNVIIGFSDILINNKRDAEEKRIEYYHDIKSSGEHLLGIINDIIDISRIEAGHSELLDDVIDLKALLNQMKRMMTPIAGKQGVTLVINEHDRLPDIRGNERLVRQMLLNLLSNAMKFTPEGGRVSVAVETLPASWLRICVSDNGIGMSASDIDRALLLFGQVDDSFSRTHQGAGLGLPLTKTMIERHGGEMVIDSEVDKGTSVSLLFPPERAIWNPD